MPVRMTIKVGSQEIHVIELDFRVSKEDWNEYDLLDGGRVRLKTTPFRIFRVLDDEGKPAYTDDGDPNIIVRHNTQIVAIE